MPYLYLWSPAPQAWFTTECFALCAGSGWFVLTWPQSQLSTWPPWSPVWGGVLLSRMSVAVTWSPSWTVSRVKRCRWVTRVWAVRRPGPWCELWSHVWRRCICVQSWHWTWGSWWSTMARGNAQWCTFEKILRTDTGSSWRPGTRTWTETGKVMIVIKVIGFVWREILFQFVQFSIFERN